MAASTIVTTAGAANANSYCDYATAVAYHDDRPEVAAWEEAVENPNKDVVNRALLFATRLLDEHIDWRGSRVDSTQALEWPRAGLMKRNMLDPQPDNEIPLDLQHATAEFARHLIEGERVGESAVEKYGLDELELAGVKLKFSGQRVTSQVVPDAVMDLLPDQWGSRKSAINAMVMRA